MNGWSLADLHAASSDYVNDIVRLMEKEARQRKEQGAKVRPPAARRRR